MQLRQIKLITYVTFFHQFLRLILNNYDKISIANKNKYVNFHWNDPYQSTSLYNTRSTTLYKVCSTTHVLDKLRVGKHNEVVEHIMNTDIRQLFTEHTIIKTNTAVLTFSLSKLSCSLNQITTSVSRTFTCITVRLVSSQADNAQSFLKPAL